MFCMKCGAENADENRFCEACGEELLRPVEQENTEETEVQKEPEETGAQERTEEAEEQEETVEAGEPENNGETEEPGEQGERVESTTPEGSEAKPPAKNKKIIIGAIVAAVVVLVCTIALVANMGGKPSAEYNEKIAQADQYMEDMEYEKAETAYLEAIEIEPNIDDAYLKLADTYVVQEKYVEAVDILEQGAEAAGGEEIEEKLNQVGPYSSYYTFLEEQVIPETGLVQVDETYHWGESSGLVSAVIKDIDNDKTPELITVSYGPEQAAHITISLYTSEDGKVVLLDEFVENALDDGTFFGNQYELFLKEYEGQYYVVLEAYMVADYESAITAMHVYQIGGSEKKIKRTAKVEAYGLYGSSSYYVNDELVAEYDGMYGEDYSEEEQLAVVETAIAAFEDAVGKYGLSGKFEAGEYGKIVMLGYDESDETEVLLSYIQHGYFTDTGGVSVAVSEHEKVENRRIIYDYTDLRAKLNQ